ncbi:MAG: hypothetical protein J0I09_02275 [Sphingobacteriia bacterium]|nr:hypothetical protein [Sphingobacteriia bacterium]
MKKTILSLIFIMVFAGAGYLNAQVRVGINVNIGQQPCWGPVGYDHVDYYYLPDIECYYYVPRHQYVYFDDDRWMFATALPPRFRPFDIDRCYKVVMNEPQPYLHFNEHRVKYAEYRNWNQRQPILHGSDDDRYRGHWEDRGYHKGWYKNDHDDRGRGDNDRHH